MIDLEEIKWRLAETIAWCTPRVNVDDPEHSLRSPELDPQAEIGIFHIAMKKVAEKRADLLRKNHLYPSKPVENLKTGRLLLYFPDRNTTDGAVPYETDNFFDYDDIPPWDTWISSWATEDPNLGSNFLLCWIPSEFEDLVSAGIGVSILSDIEWADNLHPDYHTRDLKENNLWPYLEALLAQLKPE